MGEPDDGVPHADAEPAEPEQAAPLAEDDADFVPARVGCRTRLRGWAGAHLVAYGALLIAVVLFLPQGAYPVVRRWLGREGGAE